MELVASAKKIILRTSPNFIEKMLTSMITYAKLKSVIIPIITAN